MKPLGWLLVAVVAACSAACSLDRSGVGPGTPEGGLCSPVAEVCDEADNDCDGRIDETFDTANDPLNCGNCGNSCPTDPGNGTSFCAASACQITCDDGFADCNGNVADGCEALLSDAASCGDCDNRCVAPTPLCQSGGCVDICDPGLTLCGTGCVDTSDDLAHCGACDQACSPPSSTPDCVGGACTIGMCDAGRADCNAMVTDGCEQDIVRDPSHCGSCGNVCNLTQVATHVCVMGACDVGMCRAGRANCDSVGANGCEARLDRNPRHCGSCGNACSFANSMPTCSGSTCMLGACNVGFGNCDMIAANGCETNINGDVSHCGACGSACSLPGTATHRCVGRSCRVSTCNANRADCDSVDSNGCEVDTAADVTNCGSCGTVCNLANVMAHGCSGGTCRVGICDGGFADCDGTDANGCETDITTDMNCGACGNTCLGGATCMGGTCVGGCPAGCQCSANCSSTMCSCGPGCPCTWTCSGNCYNLECQNDSTCNVTNTSTQEISATCFRRSMCTFDLNGISNASITCTGLAAACDIDCTGASNCTEIDCRSGATCTLTCTGASNCRFRRCDGVQTTCPGNVTVCNGSCP